MSTITRSNAVANIIFKDFQYSILLCFRYLVLFVSFLKPHKYIWEKR